MMKSKERQWQNDGHYDDNDTRSRTYLFRPFKEIGKLNVRL